MVSRVGKHILKILLVGLDLLGQIGGFFMMAAVCQLRNMGEIAAGTSGVGPLVRETGEDIVGMQYLDHVQMAVPICRVLRV